jgi:prepilin-type N-terminal cleavage/methylation domain-containing protein
MQPVFRISCPRPRGMTLLEILVATTIAGIISAGLFSVFIQALNIIDYDEKKLTINRYIRDFTAELTENATFANYALILPDYSTRSRVSPVYNPSTGEIETAGISVPVEDGHSGDMLVLVYVDPANDRRIERIVGYYRAALAIGEAGPVRRFELEFNPSTTTQAINLLPPASAINDWPAIVELSEGLSNGRLFHNFYGRSIMVNGEIIQENRIKGPDGKYIDGTGKGRRVASNTYNFTISPRG